MIKRAAKFMGGVLSLPLRLRYAVLRRVVGESAALSAVSERAASKPGLLGIYTRQALYRRLLGQTGSDIHFGYQTLISKPQATLGDRVYLGRFCTVGWVEIGEGTRIADGVQLLSGAHHHGSSRNGVAIEETQYRAIRIGAGVWIGANAVVMADVGDKAIVGAGAVVTKPVLPGQVVAGVPAKPIRGWTKTPRSQPSNRAAA